MSSRTRNWNVKPNHPSYMTKAVKDERRRKRREKMEYRRKYGWTAQNIYASLAIRYSISKAASKKNV